MNNFIKKIISEAKQVLDLNKLQNELEIFRKKKEEYYEWEEQPTSFKGTCQSITTDLQKYLIDLGYDAHKIRGYYSNASDDFLPNTEDWEYSDIEKFNKLHARNYESSNGLKFPHWWIEIQNYIIDITEDQFHPNEEKGYRIGIYKKPISYYKKG